MTSPLHVGFVGLGNMGAPMAARLAEAGCLEVVYDIREDARHRVAAATGAAAAGSLPETASRADLVILMLPNSEVVRRVVLGTATEPGLVAGLPRGGLLLDMSSSFAVDTRGLGEALGKTGHTLLDGPVSGGVARAVSGQLAIMLGGDDAGALERVEPLLAPLGTVFRTGPLGSGHALKALNNYVSAAGLVAAAEALVLARAFGLDPDTVIDVLNASTGRNNSTENKLRQFILSQSYASGFALDLMSKDIDSARRLAESLGLEFPGLVAESELWRAARLALGTGADHTEIARYLEEMSRQ